MKKNNNKKGFTIVELVIVIAVIAILAAVLIPTFSNVIKDANKSKALQEAQTAIKVVTADYAVKGNSVTSATIYCYESEISATTDLATAKIAYSVTYTNGKLGEPTTPATFPTYDAKNSYYAKTTDVVVKPDETTPANVVKATALADLGNNIIVVVTASSAN